MNQAIDLGLGGMSNCQSCVDLEPSASDVVRVRFELSGPPFPPSSEVMFL